MLIDRVEEVGRSEMRETAIYLFLHSHTSIDERSSLSVSTQTLLGPGPTEVTDNEAQSP